MYVYLQIQIIDYSQTLSVCAVWQQKYNKRLWSTKQPNLTNHHR